MEIFVFWVLFAIIVGVAAGSRGRSGWGWFFLAVLISPLLAIILLALMPRLDQPVSVSVPVPAGATKTCPDCAETVKAEARICRHCRHDFEAAQHDDGLDPDDDGDMITYGNGRA
jgi:hypothetical protein